MSAASATMQLRIAGLLNVFVCLFFFVCSPSSSPQARQILEREYNNLLALGTDRRLDEVRSNYHPQDITPL